MNPLATWGFRYCSPGRLKKNPHPGEGRDAGRLPWGQLRLRAAAFLPREPPRDIATVAGLENRDQVLIPNRTVL